MYIQTDKDELTSLKLPGMENKATFSSNNVAQVTSEDGAILLEVDGFTEQ